MKGNSPPKTVTLYRIRDWSKHFENSQSRQYQRLSWVPIPNKHDGKSFNRMMSYPDAAALYGAWQLIVQVASKCPVRGVLADDDGPLDAEDLAAKTRCPASVFVRAFEVLTHPKIAWLECEQLPADQQHANSEPTAALGSLPLNRTEPNYPESEKKEPPPPPVTTKPKHALPDDDWQAVEAELFALDLKKAGATVELARKRDYTPARIREAIAHWKKHSDWGPGAIHYHLENTLPNVPADKGSWPEPVKGAQKAKPNQRRANNQRLSAMSHEQIREVLEWGIESECLTSRIPLDQFDDDAVHFLKIDPNQTLVCKLLDFRDAANRAPNAQPPPADSSDRQQKRTPRS